MRLFNVADGRLLANLDTHNHAIVRSARFSPDDRYAVAVDDFGVVRVWDLKDSRLVHEFSAQNGGLRTIAWSAEGPTITSAGDGTVTRWDLSLARIAAAGPDYDGSDNPAALAKLGVWYARRGVDDWAIDLLTRPGVKIDLGSPLLLARSYWRLGRKAEAAEQFRRAIAAKEAPEPYLRMCLQAVSEAPETQPVK
jgi:WD40 repeat protein